MDAVTVTLILGLISQAITTAAQLATLGQRAAAGETITKAELDAAKASNAASAKAFDDFVAGLPD